MYGLGATAVVLLQVLCIYHVLKRGRPQHWIWLILFAPGIGGAVYFFSEVLPDLRRGGGVNRVASSLVEIVRPGRALKELEEEVAISDTFRNRQALARGYLAAARYPEAVAQYGRCLQGAFKDDPSTMLELAYAHFLGQGHDQAREILEALAAAHPGYRAVERGLLLARALEEGGNAEAALQAYEGIVRSSLGEETRCRYAMLLERSGRKEQALELYGQILTNARRSPGFYRRTNREWIKTARGRLGRAGKPKKG